MDPGTVDIVIKSYLTETRSCLEKAAAIAKAAEACALSGNIEQAIEVALDIEEIVYEVSTFLNAAGMINQLGKT